MYCLIAKKKLKAWQVGLPVHLAEKFIQHLYNYAHLHFIIQTVMYRLPILAYDFSYV